MGGIWAGARPHRLAWSNVLYDRQPQHSRFRCISEHTNGSNFGLRTSYSGSRCFCSPHGFDCSESDSMSYSTIVFGSLARHSADAISDKDLLVVSDQPDQLASLVQGARHGGWSVASY